jgi:hypothetical protein
MSCYIQIEGDPSKWFIEDPFPASELTGGQPLSVTSAAPIEGLMVLSSRSASVAIFNVAQEAPAPLGLPGTGSIIYLPTATGPSAGHVGFELAAGADPMTLSSQIADAMHGGHSQTIELSGGGTLVINGATLAFVVLAPVGVGGSTPHGPVVR